jgi:RNA-binding protein YhbY
MMRRRILLITAAAVLLASCWSTASGFAVHLRRSPTTITHLSIVDRHNIGISIQLHQTSSDQEPVQDEKPNTREEEEEVVSQQPLSSPNMERAWRHVKKPLLSIGGKGATLAHGNSLRQLLEAHTVVKIKINTKQFDNSLTVAFQVLKDLVLEAGATEEPELLQVREAENIILVGINQGVRERIERGVFPLKEYIREPKEFDRPTVVAETVAEE